MSFDWLAFLDRYGIDYITSGRNVRRNNVSLPCPLCGDDPSENLGISLVGKGWACWRKKDHKGRDPHRLIMALIGCSYALADEIVQANTGGFVTTDESFAMDMAARLGVRTPYKPRIAISGKLELLPEMQPLTESALARQYAYPYLKEDRLYKYDENVEWLADRYRLQYAATGRYAYRIVFPVYQNGELMTWTGRTVARSEELRYRSLSDDPEAARREGLPVAKANVKDCILDYDNLLKGGEEIVIVEGPFDAARITFLGEDYGIIGAAMFSKTLLRRQLDLLMPLLSRFRRRTILLDSDAWADGFFAMPDYLDFRTRQLSLGDPGELSFKEFKRIFVL